MKKIDIMLKCIVCDRKEHKYYMSYIGKEKNNTKPNTTRNKPNKTVEKSRLSSKKIALIGLFCAMAYIFTLLGGLLPISVAGFLKYDPKDIIVAIAGFILGPASALAISVLTALLELVTGISTTGFYGLLMNIISTASFACISSFI